MCLEEDDTTTARQGRHAVRQKPQQQIRAVGPYVQMCKLHHLQLLLLFIHNNRLMVQFLSKSNRPYSLATEVPPNPCSYKVKLEWLLEQLSLKKSRSHLTRGSPSQEKKSERQAFSSRRHAKNSLQSQSLKYLQLLWLKQQ